jgi:hypothetical protein
VLRRRNAGFGDWRYRDVLLKRKPSAKRARMPDDHDWASIRRRKVGQLDIGEDVAGTDRPIRRRIAIDIMFAKELILVDLERRVILSVLHAGNHY